eukprot:TRINITY_DN522_c0_g1_i3.p1 TRINITY_DN522_c0_g1~~TRINITY_DN522_c0_g1_i3.p1  ORF type:complete len:496 (+),score=137.34 TRINITY_DN522_c0_g1_i3:118-1605(+)
MYDRVSFWPRGKVLGGCSAINAMFYVRGDPQNYEDWAKQGCTGWDYNSVLPYFIKSENFLGTIGSANDPFKRTAEHDSIKTYHGKGGPLSVSDPYGQPYVWSQRFVQAAIEAGLPHNPDYNGKTQLGVGMGHSTILNGVRDSTGHAFLRRGDVLMRKNLTTWFNTTAEKIIFQGNTAVGVVSRKNNHMRYAAARKEIIVSAGAVHTPHLLLNSGVGPAKHLGELGIPVVCDLPVGQNLQDHLMVPMMFEVKDKNTLDDIANGSITKLFKQIEYTLFGTGLASCGLQSSAFYRTGLDKNGKANDAQIMFLPVSFLHEGIRIVTNTPDYTGGKFPDYAITFLPSLLLPKSVGDIKLDKKNPQGNPLIDPHFLENSYDLEVLVHCMKLVRKIAQAPCLKGLIGAEVRNVNIKAKFESDEYLRELAKQCALTIYHPVGTTKMGAANDPTAVVDPQLRVKGLKGLRVADASVMPTIISGNTNAPCIMIGEKCADLIKKGR